MTGLPSGVCPPKHDSWNAIIERQDPWLNYEGKQETAPILKCIDTIFEAIGKGLFGTLQFLRMTKQAEDNTKGLLTERMNLAQSNHLTDEETEILLVDPNPLVRIELAWNESISEFVLLKLIRDRNSSVSSIAKVRLSGILQLSS